MDCEAARRWVQNEIEQMMDLYGNTRRQAAEFVLDLLEEGEYRDELADEDVATAIAAAVEAKRGPAPRT